MSLLKVICPGCGSDLYVETGCEYCFCRLCGEKTSLKDITVAERFDAAPKPDRNAEKLMLEKAFSLTQEGRFLRAGIYFEEILSENPVCSKAYLGRLMCRREINTLLQLFRRYEELKNSKEFTLAVKYATAEDFDDYNAILNSNMNRDIEKISGRLDEIEKQIENISRYLEERKASFESNEKAESSHRIFTFLSLVGFLLPLKLYMGGNTAAAVIVGVLYVIVVDIIDSGFIGSEDRMSDSELIGKKLNELRKEKDYLISELNKLSEKTESVNKIFS